MNGMLLTLIGLTCAIVWLVVLVVTNFSGVSVGIGLLAVLSISGSPVQHRKSSIH